MITTKTSKQTGKQTNKEHKWTMQQVKVYMNRSHLK